MMRPKSIEYAVARRLQLRDFVIPAVFVAVLALIGGAWVSSFRYAPGWDFESDDGQMRTQWGIGSESGSVVCVRKKAMAVGQQVRRPPPAVSSYSKFEVGFPARMSDLLDSFRAWLPSRSSKFEFAAAGIIIARGSGFDADYIAQPRTTTQPSGEVRRIILIAVPYWLLSLPLVGVAGLRWFRLVGKMERRKTKGVTPD